ncbi:PucR family transcriptional regulator [Janibacter alittae]|uniref:Helix-turn-helix domain-containing protein n=1 Tax=Janibacter alittae TaxID=3115209 RepID=A0ABZ2ML14_9MICO
MGEGRSQRVSSEALVVDVAAHLTPRLSELSEGLRDRLSQQIEELQGDAPLVNLLYASIQGNIENILSSLQHGISLEDIEPPSAAYEYARRLAQRGVPASALVRAYRLGQQNLLEYVFEACEQLEADPTLRADAYRTVVYQTFDYIDWISQGVNAVYEAERERWLAERSSARSGRVEDLVAGRSVDVDAAEAVIGYRLRAPHLAAVLWVHGTGAQQDQLSRFTRAAGAIAAELGCQRAPLVITHDRVTAWVWFPVPEGCQVDVDRIRAALVDVDRPPTPAVALGRIHSGVSGFRTSHLQAVRAQQVATVHDDDLKLVTSFDEPGLRVTTLLVRDLETTAAWVQETLGDLAADGEQQARLRHTLQQFFQHGGSYTATADAMLMHKNSVKYRLAAAEKVLGRSIASDRQSIELAVTACHWLGSSVLNGD